MTISQEIVRGLGSSRVAAGVALVVAAGDSDRGQEIQRALQIQGYRVEFAHTYEQSLDQLSGRSFDLLVVQIRRWDRATQNFLATARMGHLEQPIALVGSRSNIKKANELIGASRLYSLTDVEMGRAISKALSESRVGPIPVQTDTLYALLRSAEITTEGQHISAVVEAMWPAIVRLTNASDIIVHTMMPETGYLKISARFSSMNRRGQQTKLSASALKIARKTVKRRRVYVPKPEDDHNGGLKLDEFGLEQALSWPLISDGQIVGAVSLFFTDDVQGRETSINDLLIKMFHQLSVLVERANLKEAKSQPLHSASEDLSPDSATQHNSPTQNDDHDSVRRLLGHLVSGSMPDDVTPDRYEGWIQATIEHLGHSVHPLARDLVYLRDIGIVTDDRPPVEHHRRSIKEVASGVFPTFLGREEVDSTPDGHQEDRYHALHGSQVLTDMGFSDEIVGAVRHHHENYDGTGHPHGLSGEEIPILARVLRVLDGYSDVLEAADFADEAYTESHAQDTVLAEVGGFYDPVVVQAFMEVLEIERAQASVTEMPTEDQMYSIISHELRSPLSLLLGHAEQLAMDEDLPEEAAERVNALRGEVVRMSRLLGRLQEDAVSDGLDDIISESVDMNEIVGQVLSYSAQQYPDYQVEYSGTEEPAIVMGDEVRLLQVISNLLDNAVKYSRQDHNMKIRLRRDKQDLILSVADRGIGIPEDLREKVFDRFYRVDNELTREESGQGFGLSLARTIVEAHKGRIWIDWTDSQNKIGATLNVALPAEPEAI